jgi:hypothetical protein
MNAQEKIELEIAQLELLLSVIKNVGRDVTPELMALYINATMTRIEDLYLILGHKKEPSDVLL